LHVLPVDLARGAQTYARELRLALDDASATRHRTVTLFRSPPGALRPDLALDAPSGPLRRAIDPRAVVGLRRMVRREGPDVVVAHGGEPLKYAALAGIPKDRLVYYKIGIGGDRLRGARGTLHRWMLRRVGTIAAVSNDAADEVRAWSAATDVVVIPNGREPALFDRREVTARVGRARLVFVGHMTASKRPELFVEVVRRLRAAALEFDASMAGDGPRLDGLRDAADAAGVTLLGRVDDVPGLLACSDVMVMTSVPEGEGMPGVLIEGGLGGLAVVTTRVPGAADVVVDGDTGFVVPVDDMPALVDACSSLVRDPEMRARFGAAARARCEREFSIAASIGKWRELLSSIDTRSCTSST
jgi:glycosyltransferase involved in cell wall biosynthesis